MNKEPIKYINEKGLAEFKKYMTDYIQQIVQAVKEIHYGYKFLTFDTGCKMLKNRTLQFTRGDKLNDEFDLSISKFDLSFVKILEKNISEELHTKLQNKIQVLTNEVKSFGICSMGINENNPELWGRYAFNKSTQLTDGICVKIDLIKTINYLIKNHREKIFGLPVLYKETTNAIIKPIPFSADKELKFFATIQLFQTKTLNWANEREIRLVYPKPLDDEFCRFTLPPDCFSSIIVGRDISNTQLTKVRDILSQWPTSIPKQILVSRTIANVS